MSAEYATFGLAPATRAGGVPPGGAGPAHRDFTDFIVDGRPLLLTLGAQDSRDALGSRESSASFASSASFDGVSPLAADVPPAIPPAEVPALLLDAPAPLAGGRCVLYACSDCGALECGAVTAVVERDGADVIWRDFAWQTSPHADPARDGYPGTGPFRFRGDSYRAALERFLAEPAAGPAADPRRAP